jgi:hypothetical protein
MTDATVEAGAAGSSIIKAGWFSRIWGVLYGGGLLAVAGALLACAGLLVAAPEAPNLGLAVGMLALAAPMGFMGFEYLAEEVLSATVLTADTIESHRPFGGGRLSRSQIRGWRRIWSPQGWESRIRLEPLRADVKPVVVLLYDGQAAVMRWLDGLPDLDDVEHAASEKALLGDVRLGDTPQARRTRLDRLHGVAKAVNILCLLAAFVVGFGFAEPNLVVWAIAGAAPLLVLLVMLATERMTTIWIGRGEARPKLGGPLFVAAAPGVRLLLHPHIIDAGAAALQVFGLGFAALVLFLLVDRPRTHVVPAIVTGALLFVVWAAGAVIGADRLFDHAPAQAFRAQVTDKHISHARRGWFDYYYIELAPWGPEAQGQELEDRGLYDAVDVGQSVCLRLHPGALGLRWYEAAPCLK